MIPLSHFHISDLFVDHNVCILFSFIITSRLEHLSRCFVKTWSLLSYPLASLQSMALQNLSTSLENRKSLLPIIYNIYT